MEAKGSRLDGVVHSDSEPRNPKNPKPHRHKSRLVTEGDTLRGALAEFLLVPERFGEKSYRS